MTGIPSVGDILMLSQIAWKIGRAFTAGRRGAPAEFLEVETEVNGLARALKLLAESLFAEPDDSILKQADKETQDGLSAILTSCQRTVKDLDSLIDQYQVIKKHRTTGGFAIERSWSDLVLTSYKTMMWTTEGGNIQHLRNMLQMHSSTITLTMQAIQSKSLARLESIVTPLAEKIDNIHHRTGSLGEQLKEIHQLVVTIASQTPSLPPTYNVSAQPPGTLKNGPSTQNSPIPDSFLNASYFPPRISSRSPPQIPLPKTPTPTIPLGPSSPIFSHQATSPGPRKRVSEFSFSGTTVRYSDGSVSSDGGNSAEWPDTPSSRSPQISRKTSTRRPAKLPITPEIREPGSRPDSATLSPLPPPALDLPEDSKIERTLSLSNLSLHPPTKPEIVKLHRSSTTSSQKLVFEKQAFSNSAVLCDVRGVLVEYTQKINSLEDSHEVEMIQACQDCRILVVRKRELAATSKSIRVMTSIWVFSDDNTLRMQLKMGEGDVYVPYSSYFKPEKISITVPCELKLHDVKYGNRPLKTIKTAWINYVFDDMKGAAQFQNEIMGRTLLATIPTAQTLRVHEGFSGAFSYAEQMCGMENLRIWEDPDTLAVIAMIHFSAHFRPGYLAFYLNSSDNPIRVKDEGNREVKIKGLRVPLERGLEKGRKDSVVTTGKEGKDKDGKNRFITGAKVEFEREDDKKEFIALVKDVQRTMRELPDLLGVN